jgi:hypothetical protein
VGWFEEYLAGGPKISGGITLAHDPWDGSTSSFKSLPGTRHLSVNLPGTKKLGPKGSTRRTGRLTGGPLETFGDGYLTVRYSGQHLYGTLIATVAVKGQSTPVTVGAAPVTKVAGVMRIPLSDQAVLLPRGKRLVVTIGRQSADGVYLLPKEGLAGPLAAQITIQRITLTLSLLTRAVSR